MRVQSRPLAGEFSPQAVELVMPGGAFPLVGVLLAAQQLGATGPLDEREAGVQYSPIEQSPQGQGYGWVCLFIGKAERGVHRSSYGQYGWTPIRASEREPLMAAGDLGDSGSGRGDVSTWVIRVEL